MPCMRIPALRDVERRNRRLEIYSRPVRSLQVIGARRRVAIRRRPGRALRGGPKEGSGNLEWKGKVMVKIVPCQRCGSTPHFKPYYQSVDGNHDMPASVTCRACGRSTVMDWNLWREAEEEVGDEKYAKPTAYLSAMFMDALNDATIRKWNRENGGE